ncbi:hypothetical protein [Sphingomonas sp.]|uniref:hypothetical protein n=1 Tax=Sphingomonas sp. TaxID=28214 RepID=UPI002E33B909|nr:hypothetical protein [Sphingomonas sp.]HEX4695986.1 hypothetical protein [Sphingomonas sp.]
MNVFLILGLLATQASGDQTLEGSSSFTAPPSINTAIRKYLDCLQPTLMRNSQKAGRLHAEGIRKIIDQSVGECAATRAAARDRVLKLIARDASIAESGRFAEVDRVFSAVDHAFDGMVDAIAAEDAKAATEEK